LSDGAVADAAFVLPELCAKRAGAEASVKTKTNESREFFISTKTCASKKGYRAITGQGPGD
jgi:hypothetical protein